MILKLKQTCGQNLRLPVRAVTHKESKTYNMCFKLKRRRINEKTTIAAIRYVCLARNKIRNKYVRPEPLS